jgi:anti-sigma factor RsiW
MNCDYIQDLILTDYLDGEVSPETKAQIEQHTAECAECRTFLFAALQTTIKPLSNAEKAFEAKEEVWNKIQTQIEEEQVQRPSVLEYLSRGFKTFFAVPRAGVAFSAVIIALLTAAIYFQSPQSQVIPYGVGKAQLITDVADDLNGDDEESYGTTIESYFL